MKQLLLGSHLIPSMNVIAVMGWNSVNDDQPVQAKYRRNLIPNWNVLG